MEEVVVREECGGANREKTDLKFSLSSFLIGHFRKVALLVINFFFNREVVFRFIGLINKRVCFLNSVFVAYGASEEYAYAYTYPRHRKMIKWKPCIIGIFKQNGKWGLMTAVSSVEEDFCDHGNIGKLKDLLDYTENLRTLLNASQKTFAGILPGIFFINRLMRESVEAEVTVAAVLEAEAIVRRLEGCEQDTPVVILGGRGFIGRRLIKKMEGRDVYCVDVKNGSCNNEWPNHLVGSKMVIVNVTKRGAILDYANKLWPGTILLNEVYPAPSEEELAILTKRGCRAYHVVGVKAMSLPPFPSDYAGGIPCCAAWNSNDMDVLVRELN